MNFNGNLQNIKRKNIILAVLILLLLLGNIFFAVKYFLQIKETQIMQKEVANRRTNAKVVIFLDLFIEKVIKTDKEVSFEDRLQLEKAIRDIDDPDLLSKWQKFTDGNNEDELQKGVKDLLGALVKKITY